jgi:site-specific DNA recombinase
MPPRKQHPAKGWAGAFDRTSLVRTDIHQDSPENQQRLNRQAAPAYGLRIKPGYIFSERGVRASRPIPRAAIERGIRAVVQEKAIEALIFPSVDRCSRLGMRHVGEMLEAVEAVGGRIIFARNSLDSSLPAHRAIIAFQAEQAKDESDTLSWRIGTWREGCRIKGKWTGKRPYGYLVVDGKLVPHPDEVPIARRIVAEFLEGMGLGSIAAALNDEGVLSPAASKAREILAEGRESKSQVDMRWSRQTLTRILHNPALAGWQRHKGRIVLGPDGEPVSFGEGILTSGEHARVLAELDRRTEIVRHNQSGKRRIGTKIGGGRPATNLLIGFACCDGCNYSMETLSAYKRIGGRYRCGTWSRSSPCPARAEIRIDHADEEVVSQLRTRLGAMEPDDPILDAIAENWRDLTMPEDEGERAVLQFRLDAVRARIVDLEEARYVRGDFITDDDIARWDGMMDRLKMQREAVLQDLDELGPPPDFDLNSLRARFESEAWDATPMPQRRGLLQVAVAKVVIKRAARRGAPATDRVRLVLVGEEPEASHHEPTD